MILEHLEAEVVFKRYLDRFLAVGAGAVVEDQAIYAALVAVYTIPGNIVVEGYLRHDGKAVMKLKKSILLASVLGRGLSLDLEPTLGYKHEFEWIFKSWLTYKLSERMSFGINYTKSNHHDRDSSIGFGVKINF